MTQHLQLLTAEAGLATPLLYTSCRGEKPTCVIFSHRLPDPH